MNTSSFGAQKGPFYCACVFLTLLTINCDPRFESGVYGCPTFEPKMFSTSSVIIVCTPNRVVLVPSNGSRNCWLGHCIFECYGPRLCSLSLSVGFCVKFEKAVFQVQIIWYSYSKSLLGLGDCETIDDQNMYCSDICTPSSWTALIR